MMIIVQTFRFSKISNFKIFIKAKISMSSFYQDLFGINNTSIALLIGLGIGVFGFNLNEKIINKIKSTKQKKAAELLKKKYENLKDKELSLEFKNVLHQYIKEFEESQILEKIIEKKVDDQSQIRKLSKGFTYTQEDEQQHDLIKCLSEPIWEMLKRGGKRIRPIFCALIAEAYNHKLSDVIEIAGFIEVLHNCSLIIDDIEDDSLKRREKDAVHIIYGVDISINAANYGYYAPLNYLLNLKKYNQKTISQLSLIYAYEMSQIHLGQGWDLLWHNQKKESLKIPTEQQYLQMVVNKTGALFRMMIRMLGVVLNLEERNVKMLSLFTEKVGAVFQIQDDIINLDSPDYTTKGKRGEDITEGKITVIAIHALNNNTEDKKQRLFEILCMKTQDQTLVDEAIEIMQQSGSIQYAKELASQIMEQAWQELDKSLPESESKYKLKLICQFILKRQS
ncbi:polyprenyl synthetase protein (macronuclear) [Tetrahymena thermophila SB210]|uniref:Polyprenyl synthetase protein n=1 Tax=Tetrahymena thermophila (strain SB210) TaxID=312017 RepID=I7M9U7_TETTS|nr:polyprenyl synthetase protein [Tetrahymena thermophila SB210]EAS02845.2 polyprenyl synthetase protein [Tetrahymena thermophila SB210]|eukprot:XP_001023090.2 polyprenyl synthetase protein [Tetrahymena thermophila SB210]